MTAASDRHDYYEILLVHRDAPVEIIRSSYRTLMQQLKNHPDLGGDTARAALINEAYAVLTDPARRAEYDARQELLRSVGNGSIDEPAEAAPATESRRIADPATHCVFCNHPHNRGGIVETDDCCIDCGSPLCPARDLQTETADKRTVDRIIKRLPLVLFTHWPQETGIAGQTEDMSPKGLRLVTKLNLQKDQVIRIHSSVFDAVGSVTNCVPNKGIWSTNYVAGVSFITLRFVTATGAFVSRQV